MLASCNDLRDGDVLERADARIGEEGDAFAPERPNVLADLGERARPEHDARRVDRKSRFAGRAGRAKLRADRMSARHGARILNLSRCARAHARRRPI